MLCDGFSVLVSSRRWRRCLDLRHGTGGGVGGRGRRQVRGGRGIVVGGGRGLHGAGDQVLQTGVGFLVKLAEDHLIGFHHVHLYGGEEGLGGGLGWG